MTRIGFAYNQKPDPIAAPAAELARADEEPPSSGGAATLVAPATAPDDEFAEWDSAETIDAVERALARHGEVIRLEADRRLPAAAARRAPRHRLQHRRRTARPEPRGARPGDLRVLRHSLLGQRSLHPRALPRQGAHEGDPPRPWRAHRRLVARRARAERAAGAADPRARAIRYSSSRCTKDRPRESPNGTSSRRRGALAPIVLELLERYQQPVIVEAFLPGAEFTCGVLGNGAEARVLPLVGHELRRAARRRAAHLRLRGEVALGPSRRAARDLRVPGSHRRRAARRDRGRRPARPIRRSAAATGRASTCGSTPTGTPNVVEVNPLPGILPDPADNSCLPKAARAAGLDYDALIGALPPGRGGAPRRARSRGTAA